MTEMTNLPPAEKNRTKPYPYSALFWRVILAFAVLGTFIPWLSQPTIRDDVFEQIIAGHEWVISTFRHPALSTWICEILWRLTGHALFAPYLASMLCVSVTIWAVWRLSREYLDEKRAMFAGLILTGFWYFNMGSAMYNNSLPLTMFWYLGILAFHFALTRKKLIYWLAAGAAMGLAMLCKVTSIFFILGMLIYFLASRYRALLKTPGPWLGTILALAIYYPDFLFFREYYPELKKYVDDKVMTDQSFVLLLTGGWLKQIAIVAPLWGAVLPLIRFRKPSAALNGGSASEAVYPPEEAKTGAGRFFPLAMFLIPIGLMIIAQCASQIAFTQDSYGFPIWGLLGLCLLYYFPIYTGEKFWRLAVTLSVIFTIGELVSLPVQSLNNYFFNKHGSWKFYPACALSEEVDALWAEHSDTPCPFVTGDYGPRFFYGVYSRYLPRVDAIGYAAWNTDDDVRKTGGVYLWDAVSRGEALPEDAARFPGIRVVKYIEKPYLQRSTEIPPARWGIALFPPSAENPALAANEPANETVNEPEKVEP